MKHKNKLINYNKRKKTGKCIGSKRMECGVNQIIGRSKKSTGCYGLKKEIKPVQFYNKN